MTLLQFLSSLIIYTSDISTVLILDPMVVKSPDFLGQWSLEWAVEAALLTWSLNGLILNLPDCRSHTSEHSLSPNRMVELMANYFLCSLAGTWRLNEEKSKLLLKKLPKYANRRLNGRGYHQLLRVQKTEILWFTIIPPWTHCI